jgi:hypothetical protein
MPQSKHRRKSGGKSVKHPGPAAVLRNEKRKQEMGRIEDAMVSAARDVFADTAEDARYMAEMVMAWMDEPTLTTSKAALPPWRRNKSSSKQRMPRRPPRMCRRHRTMPKPRSDV